MLFRISRMWDFVDLFQELRSIVSDIFSRPLYDAWSSPGARSAQGHLLAMRIRKSEVMSGPLCLRPHDMPMARYTTSRLRRSHRYLLVAW